MKIALIQIHSVPNEIEDNVKHGIEMYHDATSKGAKCIVFPELWTCGYYLEKKDFFAAVEKNEVILEMFQRQAQTDKVMIILPLPIIQEKNLYIGLYIIENNGKIIGCYHKSFLWGREQNYFNHGKREYNPINTSIGKIGVLICYDIEFPEPSRILALKGAQIIFVPSVWSIPAKNRWDIQLPARALDNTVFIAGINNTGEGACGHTKFIGPCGEVLDELDQDNEAILVFDIDYSEIDRVREKIPYIKESDSKLIPGGKL